MLFQRRNPPTRKERLRLLVWPRRSFSRSLRYGGKRILRITASPHAVAAGLAVGVFSAFTPFFGFQPPDAAVHLGEHVRAWPLHHEWKHR